MARRRRRSGTGSRGFLVASILLFMASVAAFIVLRTQSGEELIAKVKSLTAGAAPSCCGPGVVLNQFQIPVVAYLVNDLWRDGRARALKLPPRMSTPAQAVYVGLSSNGHILRETWVREGTVEDAVTAALTRFRSEMPAADRARVDAIELFLGHSFRPVAFDDYDEQIAANHHRGIRGLEISYQDRTELHSPLELIRRNVSADRLVRDFAAANHLDRATLLRHGSFRIFDGEQILVELGSEPKGWLMERGNTYVDVHDIDQSKVRKAVRLATDWLANNVGLDGALPYGYRPSELKPLEGTNRVRQWMASIALERATRLRLDQGIWELAERNLAYNIDTTYRQEGPLGVIVGTANDVSLGSVALAAMAITESHVSSRYTEQRDGLDATISALHQDNGAFRTYLRPPSRDDNQNFYPGETLLYWAERYQNQPDPALLGRFMTSFRYYRDWHREHRSPAFIGWHTEADYLIWRQTRDPALRDFVFEMNDWLLPLQQWAIPTEYRDLMGRFYAPNGHFGPPHASSTGIYLEGLVDAFRLARESGDAKRAEAYRIAILRGLRDVLQLQFVDDVDMFYIPRGFRPRVKGGIRTRGYDNVIRVDNVQHNLMAMLKVLAAFKPDDYRYPANVP
ncbi:MAG: hypothetical protein GC201_14420 [Alphaproteobacteria bacterium]|nr:hypothetical protein [Alphaproteobacteria bacterium]